MCQFTTTPYHPMCNGLVERFNGTLKQILRRLCFERPADWDKYLSASLFVYRDTPQESLEFSLFELVYGHKVRGPMKIVRELLTKEVEDPEVRATYQYVVDLKKNDWKLRARWLKRILRDHQEDTETTTTKVHGETDGRGRTCCQPQAISFLCNGRVRSQL